MSPVAGTTRDLIEAPVIIAGIPFVFIDTAGLRERGDEIEEIGVSRAQASLASTDLILWLGEAGDAPVSENVILVAPKADLAPDAEARPGISVSTRTGDGMAGLVEYLTVRARSLLPAEGEVSLNARHRILLKDVMAGLNEARNRDPLIAAEGLRRARLNLDAITGRAGIEHMLDALFGRFCIGK